MAKKGCWIAHVDVSEPAGLHFAANREQVVVRLRHQRVHAEDCVDCEDKPTMLDRIDCKIEFIGALDETQRARLREIADHCPVHRTLTSKIDIRTSLMLAWPSGGEVPATRLPRNLYQAYTKAALRRGMAGVVETSHFATSIRLNSANRDILLAMDPLAFVRQMAFWESFFNTSADLPVAGCRANDEEWASITVPATITGGVDPVHPAAAAERLHRLLPNSRRHEAIVSEAEWTGVFDNNPYPVTADFQGERIAAVWRAFVREIEAGPSARGNKAGGRE